MSPSFEEPILEEELHIPDNPVDDIGILTEDEGNSHRPS
jgi:hypothetical protein